MIDLAPEHLETVRRILAARAPDCEVRAFGSRVTWTAKDYSDLDLAVVGESALDPDRLRQLREDFEESDLPIRVDVIDWHAISPEFRKVIEGRYEVTQPRKKSALGSEWRASTWGEEISLEYGKALRDHDETQGRFRVFGSNGPIGWTPEPLVQGPGVILGRKGAYRGVEYSREPFFVIDTAYYVVPKTELDMRWLYYAIKHYNLGGVDDGSPIPSTTRTAVYMLEVDVPPLREQRAIARILGTLDDKIELNQRISETLEAMARALFKSWFVDFDPVRAKAEGRDPGLPKPLADLFPDSFEDSELGEIPRGWIAAPLYDIATYTNGAAYAAFQPNDERKGLPIIKIAELKAGVTAQTRFSDVQMPEKYRVSRGDILFSWSGNPDTSIDIFVWSHGSAWLNQHIFHVVPHHQHERAFLLSTLTALRPIFAEIARDKQTTGLGHVTAADMKRLLVVRPDERLMRAWETVAGPLLERTFQSEVEVNCVSTLRDALLPKLISGELLLKDAEIVIEETA